MTDKKLIYDVDEIFVDIPEDPDNVILKFPPEVIEETGWKEGDTIDITTEDGRLILKKL